MMPSEGSEEHASVQDVLQAFQTPISALPTAPKLPTSLIPLYQPYLVRIHGMLELSLSSKRGDALLEQGEGWVRLGLAGLESYLGDGRYLSDPALKAQVARQWQERQTFEWDAETAFHKDAAFVTQQCARHEARLAEIDGLRAAGDALTVKELTGMCPFYVIVW
jgi:hypothetical protein